MNNFQAIPYSVPVPHQYSVFPASSIVPSRCAWSNERPPQPKRQKLYYPVNVHAQRIWWGRSGSHLGSYARHIVKEEVSPEFFFVLASKGREKNAFRHERTKGHELCETPPGQVILTKNSLAHQSGRGLGRKGFLSFFLVWKAREKNAFRHERTKGHEQCETLPGQVILTKNSLRISQETT